MSKVNQMKRDIDKDINSIKEVLSAHFKMKLELLLGGSLQIPPGAKLCIRTCFIT